MSLALDGPHDQLRAARVRERKMHSPNRSRMFDRPKFKDIFRKIGFRGVLCRIRGLRVDADAVRDERRAVAAAVDHDLQCVAHGPVAGLVGGDEVGEVDFTPFARRDLSRIAGPEQSAHGFGAQFEADRALRGVRVADRRLHLPARINIGEGVERRGQPQPSAGIDGVEFLDGFLPRNDTPLHGERGDFPLFRGVDPQFLGECAGAVGGVVGDGDLRLFARKDRFLREIGDRAAAGGHHVENHQGAVAAVDARERVAHAAVGFADRAEVPRIGLKSQTFLRQAR